MLARIEIDVSGLQTEYRTLSAKLCGIRQAAADPEQELRRAALMERIEVRAREIEQDLASAGAPVWAVYRARPETSARAWRWLRVQWGKEQNAANHLREAHVPCYWPNYPTQGAVNRKAKSRWRQERLRPLIPGSLFLLQEEGADEPWFMIDRTPGVSGVMRAPDGHPLRVPDADIALVRRIEAEQNTPTAYVVHAFKLGQKVRFTEDIHTQWPQGIVSRLYKNGRIGVDVTVLGRVALFDVQPHQIEAM